ncbi:MAG: zinc ABC transporter substrate-binding protein [Planctomycetota bacterium]
MTFYHQKQTLFSRLSLGSLAFLLAFGLITGGCGNADDPADAPEASESKPTVVATTTMLDDLVRTLGGDRIDVVGLMKPGQDPHQYDVLPRDAQTIAEADLVVANGLNLEATLHDVIENNAKGKIVYAAEQDGIETLGSEDYEGAPDPHCWMDVSMWKLYVAAVRDGLIEIDPDGRAEYEANAEANLIELDELQEWISERFAEVPETQRVIITSHDAFNYFGAANSIEVHGVIGISTEQAPRPQDLAVLENLVRDRNVKALFIESSVSPALNAMVEKVAEQTGTNVGGTLYSDSLGQPGSGADTYIGMMKHNVSTVVEALK